MSDDHHNPVEEIAALADGASAPSVAPDPTGGAKNAAQPSHNATPQPADDDSDDRPSDMDTADGKVDREALRACAELDQSDTDNSKRLMRYFGADITMIAEEGSAGGVYLTWSGTHWDVADGLAGAHKLAQRIGGLIGLEADYITATPRERDAIRDGERAKADLPRLMAEMPLDRRAWTDTQRTRLQEFEMAIDAMKSAKAALAARRKDRRRFGVASKNQARIENMLKAAQPHLRLPPAAFNADDFVIVTRTHTLRFARELDLECPDPDIERWHWHLDAVKGHRREDLITNEIAVDYDPEVKPVKWLAFLDRCMPAVAQANKRRTLQAYSGLGLLGVVLQHLMFHYGEGANGKSVFLETLVRLLGDSFAVSLPPETLTGTGDRNAGGAAPDILRLFGKRMLRVPEIKPGVALQEDFVKRITGGETVTARGVYGKGYIDFQNKAKPHLSGNGFPRIDGTDNGIWRRMLVMHWTETIPEAERRDFEDMVKDLLTEAPAILNWLIEGALDYLNHGLYIADEVRTATQDYRDEMDTVGQFQRDCVEAAVGERVTARAMYEAYKAWCAANAKAHVLETKFGRVMKTRIKREEKRIREYLDVRLHDVPPMPGAGRREQAPHPADADELVPL